MQIINSKLAVAAALALVFCSQLPVNGQESSKSEDLKSRILSLQKEQVKTLEGAFELALVQYREGAADLQDVLIAQRDLTDAQLEVAGAPAKHIAVLTSQLKTAKDVMAISRTRFRAAATSQLDVHQAKSAALRIEIRLLKLRQRENVAKRVRPAFRQLTRDEDAVELESKGAVVMGRNLLTAEAVELLAAGSLELQRGLDRIKTVAWDRPPYSEENARLTVAQRMDDYIHSAAAYYQGKGRRGPRQADLSDVELGDKQLSSALQSVKLADAWSVPLKDGQSAALNAVVARRVADIRMRQATRK